jgi:hypothetical protein
MQSVALTAVLNCAAVRESPADERLSVYVIEAAVFGVVIVETFSVSWSSSVTPQS